MEYLLLSRNDPDNLSIDVTRYLSQGWSLYGPPVVCSGARDEGWWHYQAIVRNTTEAAN